MEDKRSLITMGLKPLLTDEALSIRVKMSICQLCVALADHGYVHPEAGGQQVIQFLLTNLILKVDLLPVIFVIIKVKKSKCYLYDLYLCIISLKVFYFFYNKL